MTIVKGFFKMIWSVLKTAQTLLFGTLAFLLLLALLTAPFSSSGPEIPEGSALVAELSGILVEEKTDADPFTLITQEGPPPEMLITDVTDALGQAASDDRIKLLVLDLNRFNGGMMPHLEIIADAIAKFRASGKKVIALSDNYSQSDLLLAVEADEVLMNPEGAAVIEGFSAYRTYFSSFLKSFDVTINLFRVGQYKSATEPYIRDGMSDEDKLSRMSYLSPWWQTYTDRIEHRRDLATGTVRRTLEDVNAQLAKSGSNLAQFALDQGLVDRLATRRETSEYLIGLVGADEAESRDYRGIDLASYLAANPVEIPDAESTIAVITGSGTISDGFAEAGGIGSLTFINRIEQALDNDSVKAIVVRVNSGGGSKTASELIRDALAGAQAQDIPVVASFGAVAASGGYWMSASADKIVAHPSSITGSIGIFAMIPTFEKALNGYGVFEDGVATTDLASGVSLVRGISPDYAQMIQQTIESGYQQFLEVVADGRGMTTEAVDAVAQGRIWTGEKAKEIGLVDELGDLDLAITLAAELAELEDYKTWRVEPEISKKQQLIKAITSEITALQPARSQPLDRYWRALNAELDFLAELNDPFHAYVLCEACPDQWDLISNR